MLEHCLADLTYLLNQTLTALKIHVRTSRCINLKTESMYFKSVQVKNQCKSRKQKDRIWVKRQVHDCTVKRVSSFGRLPASKRTPAKNFHAGGQVASVSCGEA